MNHDSKPASSPAAWAAARRSACPGLVRVVATHDGGLCRVRLPGGLLTAAQAEAIAQAALAHASGTLELTNRANLQVRGIRAGSEAALSEALVAGGLGPSASASADLCTADELRNLMLAPLAGLDPAALLDTTTLAAPIVAMLQNEPRFAALSPKFALLIDGGEALAALDHPHDIWLAATAHEGGARFMFGLAGCPGDGAFGSIAAAQATPLIRALLHAFLDLAGPGQLRMREVVAAHGLQAVLKQALRHASIDIANETASGWQRSKVDTGLRLGAHRLNDRTGYVGCQPPLARLDAATLRGLAALAQTHGDGTLRITPWQGAILPHVANDAMPAVIAALHALGLITDAAHPLARTIACTGSTGCAKSRADTKADALLLAAHLPPKIHVHLSGCERSCAAAHRAPFTLLAVAPGAYDVYEDIDESVAQNSSENIEERDAAPFGRRVARHLTIEAAAQLLEHLSMQPHAQRAPEHS
ncbi:precorrin-3B synthase [Paraburkholderia sp. Ac-20340]|uniref:precorrin-3B synthase n=1 Tax=Paraburkholderia sp. Ac-20340 TaxID=2703888 RepID=UPI001F11FDF1|nr:precorrin-3B synthase [Paraburkholderia sp. Ac-20340]